MIANVQTSCVSGAAGDTTAACVREVEEEQPETEPRELVYEVHVLRDVSSETVEGAELRVKRPEPPVCRLWGEGETGLGGRVNWVGGEGERGLGGRVKGMGWGFAGTSEAVAAKLTPWRGPSPAWAGEGVSFWVGEGVCFWVGEKGWKGLYVGGARAPEAGGAEPTPWRAPSPAWAGPS